MVSFNDNAAVKLAEPASYEQPTQHLYKAFEQSEDELMVSRLNLKLREQSGGDFKLRFFAGDSLQGIPEATLLSLARCYAEVFNESWGESWTEETAMAEVRKCTYNQEGYYPLLSLLFKGEDVVGFCWGFVLNADALHDDSTPFSSSGLKRHESVQVARYWINEVANIERLLSIRELGVLKEYRQDKSPFLCLPIFEKSKALDCKVAFLRTKVSSKAFKWSLGMGLVPIQLFMIDGLLLMHGSIKYATRLINGLIDNASRKKSQYEVIMNIKRYLCEY